MATAVYEVRGMTCDHCVNAVLTGVAKVPGVRNVAVELASGRVTVASDAPLDAHEVQAAVEEAGYELVA